MGEARLNGVSINYRCMGRGRNVVLIHGLAANQGFWHPGMLLPLARAFRVTLLDLRGHGYSAMPPSGYTSAHMAEDVCRLIDHLEIPKAHLVGHSFGGAVALQCAVRSPENIVSITVADTRVRSLQPTQCPRDWPNWAEAKLHLAAHGLVIPENETEAGLWFLENLAAADWTTTRAQLEGQPVVSPFAGGNGRNRSAQQWLQLLASTTARRDFLAHDGLTPARLAGIRKPVLSIYGQQSPVMPSERGLARHLSDYRRVVIQGAGHFFPITHPGSFFDILVAFLDQVEPQDRRRSTRWAMRLPMEIRQAGDVSFPARTVNVSEGGILLESLRLPVIGSAVDIVLPPSVELPSLVLGADIVRVKEDRHGNCSVFGVRLHADPEGVAAWNRVLTMAKKATPV